MFGIPATIAAPKVFCSPGLRRALLRLKICSEEELKKLEALGGNSKAILKISQDLALDYQKTLHQLADEIGLEFFELGEPSQQISEEMISFFEQLSAGFLLDHRIFPLAESDGSLRCAFADPLDLEALSQLEFKVEKSIIPVFADEVKIVEFIEYLRDGSPIDGEMSFDGLNDDNFQSPSVEVVVTSAPQESEVNGNVHAPPIVRLVNKVLSDAAESNSSDIHIEPKVSSLDIRFRVDGMMRPHLTIPKRLQPYVISRIKLLAKMDIAEKRRPQDGRFRMRVARRQARDVRVSSVPTAFGEKLVLRLLKPDIDDINFSSIGMSEGLTKKVKASLGRTDKIFVVTGPTGSGKSTTLYAAANYLNSGTNTLVTVENPIEFRIEGATQIEVNQKTGVTFASGLRSVLRQDPDIIMVGEVRDEETAEIAFQAAQTGHMVLTTLHTNDAAAAVVRLMDLGIEPYVISGSLAGVLAQRLVRTVCGDCRRPLTEEEIAEVNQQYSTSFTQMYIGTGCKNCEQTGYVGRTGVYSLLEVNKEIAEVIRSNGGETEITNIAKQNGMQELYDSALELVSNGVTTMEEVVRVVGRREKESQTIKPKAANAHFDKVQNETPAPALSESFVSADVSSNVDIEMYADFGETRPGSVADLASQVNSIKDADEKDIPILIIDDDEGVRAVMAAALRKAGFIVDEASNGVEALKSLRSRRKKPKLIVCDIDMPQMDGREFVLQVKESEKLSDIPILMLTGWDSEQREIDLIESGANDFVSKSSSPALVITRIRRLLA